MTPDLCPHCGREVPAPARRDERGLFITHACDECWEQQRQWKWDDTARARAITDDEGASE
jgi:uncharacterized radical SAM superfamily Fe-S cluster-containing enzyme